MATTQAVRSDFPASARRPRRPARERTAGMRAVYDQDADLTARDVRRPASPDRMRVRRVASPDRMRVRRPASPDRMRVRRPAYDPLARWLGLGSLAVVTLIVALIILF